jgi:hypothetical protein
VVKSLGELVTTGIGLAVLVRIWQVFPFDFAGWSVDWSWLVRRYGASYGGSTHRPSWTAASRCRSAGKDGRWRCRRDR